MAYSSSSSPSKTIRSPWLIIAAFLLISLAVNSTMARVTMEEDEGYYAMLSSHLKPDNNNPLKHDSSATMLSEPIHPKTEAYVDMVFEKLPKGVPVPPSGPSKRHNH